MWAATHWRECPCGDAMNPRPYRSTNHVVVNVDYFQQLDAREDQINRAGQLSVPVRLW